MYFFANKNAENKGPFAFSQTQRIASMHNGPATGETIMYFSKGIFLLGITIALCTPASAVTKCVKLSSSTTCSYVNPGGYVVDWTSNCTSSGTSVAISGISQCSSTRGSLVGQKATGLKISGGTGDKYCWCKMVSPAVSSWVFSFDYGSASSCADNCAFSCARDPRRVPSFRSALFSGLSD